MSAIITIAPTRFMGLHAWRLSNRSDIAFSFISQTLPPVRQQCLR
jgi:hypothetical protein